MRAVFLIATAVLALSACTKADAPSAPAPAAPASAAPSAPPPIAPRVEGPLGAALDAYEAMRAAYAADNGAAAVAQAQPLADAARKASEAGSAVQKPILVALADAAQKLATDKPADLKASRLLFADVSKQVVTLLVADPALREGRFIFECPMAPAYQRWVQTSSSLKNPYYGSEMLECGSGVDWKV